MVTEERIDKTRYLCDVCGASFTNQYDAQYCEGKGYRKKLPLYGLRDWKIGDRMMLFSIVDGREVVEINPIEREYFMGHLIVPYPPEVTKSFAFEFIATMEMND